jgi:hypothetical protein
MLKFTALLTVVTWAGILFWTILGLSQSGGAPIGVLALLIFEVVVSCTAIILALVAAVRRSLGASRGLVIISIIAGLVAALDIWLLISPITVMGSAYVRGISFINWMLVAAFSLMLCLPWLWVAVSRQLRVARDLTNR